MNNIQLVLSAPTLNAHSKWIMSIFYPLSWLVWPQLPVWKWVNSENSRESVLRLSWQCGYKDMAESSQTPYTLAGSRKAPLYSPWPPRVLMWGDRFGCHLSVTTSTLGPTIIGPLDMFKMGSLDISPCPLSYALTPSCICWMGSECSVIPLLSYITSHERSGFTHMEHVSLQTIPLTPDWHLRIQEQSCGYWIGKGTGELVWDSFHLVWKYCNKAWFCQYILHLVNTLTYCVQWLVVSICCKYLLLSSCYYNKCGYNVMIPRHKSFVNTVTFKD